MLNSKFDQTFMTSLIGKTKDDALKAIKKKEHESDAGIAKKTRDLDAKEGKTFFQHNNDGTWTVTQVGVK